ncbi:MAG TPA: hypothetical protein DCQ31_14135 [Bacteroidales bacterium]|nr:hypothetical protein [Bacteroidales bacterium]
MCSFVIINPKTIFMKKSIFYFVLILFMPAAAQQVTQWRGADRSGNYPETNLLTQWPATGPELFWEFAELGNGYNSPVITDKYIFINGEVDTINYLYALNLKGELLWKKEVGREWVASYPGARAAANVVGNLVYTTTGMGDVACFEAETGNKKWAHNYVTDFKAPITRFGFSESVVVNGDLVYCQPGNADTNVVALNRFTGEMVWKTKALGQMTSYCAPLLIELKDRKILVTFSKSALLGIDAANGTLLWSHTQDSEGDVHVNTPLFENGFIYYITGDGNGSVKLKLSDDGTSITEVWRTKACDGTMGGFNKIGNFIYSSGYEKRQYYAINAENGAIADSLKFDRGVVIAAENMLYLYNEKGNLGLVKPENGKMNLVSSYKVTKGTKAHYSHPVICNGILYLRRGQSLMAFNIKK